MVADEPTLLVACCGSTGKRDARLLAEPSDD